MKTIVCSIAALFLATFTISAQEEVDVKKETVTKTEVIKDGRIHTKVTNQVTEKKEVIQLQDSDALNQGRNVTTKNRITTEVVKDEVKADQANDAMLEKHKKDINAEGMKAKSAAETNNGRAQKADVKAMDDAEGTNKIIKKKKKVKKEIEY